MQNNENNFKVVNKVIMYSFNFEYNFISNVWQNDKNLANHFKSKFDSLCNRFDNSQTAFMYLYTELSDNNKQILINYILNK